MFAALSSYLSTNKREIEYIYSRFLLSDGVSIDTRTLSTDSLFVALKGTRTHGDVFVNTALKRGASFVIASKKYTNKSQNKRVICVNDTRMALWGLAYFHRSQYKRHLIAITGSCGKTTTKDLVQCVLSKKYNTSATMGNQNSLIGVPLSLLNILPQTEVAVIELGISMPSEMAFLCHLTRPTHGLITYIGLAHAAQLGDIQSITQEKKILFDYLQNNKGTIFQNTAIKDIDTQGGACLKTYANKNDDYPMICKRSKDGCLAFSIPGYGVCQSHLCGLHHSTNVGAAQAIGRHFGVDVKHIYQAIRSYVPRNTRGVWHKTKHNQVYLDCYNASPSAMRAAINYFKSLKKTNKIAILGDMAELGDYEDAEHKALAKLFSNDITWLLCGKAMQNTYKIYDKALYFETKKALAQYLQSHTPKQASIMLKASRSLALEELLKVL